MLQKQQLEEVKRMTIEQNEYIKRLAELEQVLRICKAAEGDNTPRSIETAARIQEKRIKLFELMGKLLDKMEEAEKYIEGIQDPQTRGILKAYYFHRTTWEKVGDEIHYSGRHAQRIIKEQFEQEDKQNDKLDH